MEAMEAPGEALLQLRRDPLQSDRPWSWNGFLFPPAVHNQN
jgi:hypothetical protein